MTGKSKNRINIRNYSHFIIQRKQDYDETINYVAREIENMKKYFKDYKSKSFFRFWEKNPAEEDLRR